MLTRVPSFPHSKAMAEIPPILEEWYRCHLSAAELDISSSGVEPYSFSSLRSRLNITIEELDSLVMQDSVSFGAPALRTAIGNRYAEGNDEWVMATHGSSEAIALILSSLFESGSRVIVIDPIYHSLRSHFELRGCALTRIPIDSFTSDNIDSILDAIVPGTSAVALNFPHNPTGVTLRPETVQSISDRCAERGAILCWDGAMEELVMDGDVVTNSPKLAAHVVRFGTLSKAFGLPGLRVGWCIASPLLLERTVPMRDRTTLFLSPLVELIAERAVAGASVLIEPRLMRARRNLTYLNSWIAEHSRFVEWRKPAGGVCGLMRMLQYDDAEPFCRSLLEKTGVLLVPGSAFESPQHVRIGYGGDEVELKEALGRLSRFLCSRRS